MFVFKSHKVQEMSLLNLYLLTFLTFGISDCVLEASGASSHASKEGKISIMWSRDNEHARSKEKGKEDGTETNSHGFTINKGPAESDIGKNNLHQNLPSTKIKLQSRLFRKRRYVEEEKKRVDDYLLNHVSKLGSNATMEKVVEYVVRGSSNKPQSKMSTQKIFEDNRPKTQVTSQKSHTATEKSPKDASSQTTSTASSTYFTSEDPHSEEANTASDTFSGRNEAVKKYTTNYLHASNKLKNVFSRLTRPSESMETESVTNKHSEVTESYANTSAFLRGRTSENTGFDNMTSNLNFSNVKPFPDEINDSNWTAESTPEKNDNSTMLVVDRHKDKDNISLAPLSTMSTPRRLYSEYESTLSSNKYSSDSTKRKLKDQDKAEAFDQHSRRHKPHANVTNDKRQTSSPVLLNSLNNNFSSLEDKKKISSQNIKEKILEENEKRNSQEVENEEANDGEGNDSSICSTCVKGGLTEEDVKLIRLNMFKELLAEKLRINQVDPNMEGIQSDVRTEERIPKLPQSILEQTVKDNAKKIEKDQFYARDQEIIIAGEDIGRECVKAQVTGCYSFSLRDKIKWEVTEAQLWFYRTRTLNDMKGHTIIVSDLERLKSGYLVNGSVIAREDALSQEGWISMNVTKALLQWVDMKKVTETLAIRCSTCTAKSHKSLFGAKYGYTPLLIVKYASSNPVLRTKRSETCDPRYECCKRDLVVNFHNISMTEVYEPRNLSIGYCYGGCNEIHQYTYNHTALKQRLRYSSSYVNHPTMNQQLKPCCVPLILKDAFLMTVEGNVLVRKVVPKMIVETCGCM